MGTCKIYKSYDVSYSVGFQSKLVRGCVTPFYKSLICAQRGRLMFTLKF